MKRTGPTNENTKEIIVAFEKQAKKTDKTVWKDIAKRLKKPTRIRAKTNVFALEKIAKKNNGKILVVPGKILAAGEINSKVDVACLDCSEKAKEKIEAQKGKVMTLTELVESKADVKKMVIVQ